VGLELAALRPDSYAEDVRSAPLSLLTPPLGRVLDVGCARGGGAALLRARGASYLAGVEVDPEQGEHARSAYDEVVIGSAEQVLPWEPGSFDVVLCYDVLEHLYDPWATLRRLSGLLTDTGTLHVSIPNARHWRMWFPLVVRGRFAYAPHGLRDVTHIRFFTRRDAVDMVGAAGFQVTSVAYPRPHRPVKRFGFAVTRGRLAEFMTLHWFILARPLR
jgi:2-polyprenyl-3-methyl-5-hydroxy-6-metoxy-1,4-benzoquinol methylase